MLRRALRLRHQQRSALEFRLAVDDDKSIRNLLAILCWESTAGMSLQIVDDCYDSFAARHEVDHLGSVWERLAGINTADTRKKTLAGVNKDFCALPRFLKLKARLGLGSLLSESL